MTPHRLTHSSSPRRLPTRRRRPSSDAVDPSRACGHGLRFGRWAQKRRRCSRRLKPILFPLPPLPGGDTRLRPPLAVGDRARSSPNHQNIAVDPDTSRRPTVDGRFHVDAPAVCTSSRSIRLPIPELPNLITRADARGQHGLNADEPPSLALRSRCRQLTEQPSRQKGKNQQ